MINYNGCDRRISMTLNNHIVFFDAGHKFFMYIRRSLYAPIAGYHVFRVLSI